MEEKFEWIDIGVFEDYTYESDYDQDDVKNRFKKTIYNEGGCELDARFQVQRRRDARTNWYYVGLSLWAKPCQPPMLNVRMKVFRQGFFEPSEPLESRNRTYHV